MKHDPLHVAIAFDENYLSPVYALLTSIFLNQRGRPVAFHAIATGVGQVQQVELADYARQFNGAIAFYKIDKNFGADFMLPATLWWTTSIYYRLLFPALLPPGVDKFLYLDTDILVLQSLDMLFATDMKGKPVAAVTDKALSRPELGISEADGYFNSGVLLIDKQEWIEQGITEKAVAFIREHANELINPDQDALNVALRCNWARLDKRFNLMYEDTPQALPKKGDAEFLRDVVVLHFTTQHKPWAMIGQNRLRYLYHYYLRRAPRKYRRYYLDFAWNRHRIREMLELRFHEFRLNCSFFKKQ